MWTVYWSRDRLDDEQSWEADSGISSEPKALGIARAMLLKGWIVHAIFRNRNSVWNEARISERCGKPNPQFRYEIASVLV